MENSEAEKAWIVYAGPRTTRSTIRYAYYRLDSLDFNDGRPIADLKEEEKWYERKLFTKGSVGCIYEVSFTDNQVLFSKTAAWIAMWKNDSDRLKWKAFDVAGDELKTLKAAASENLLTKALSPIREAYDQSSVQGRRLLLAEVMRFITQPKYERGPKG